MKFSIVRCSFVSKWKFPVSMYLQSETIPSICIINTRVKGGVVPLWTGPSNKIMTAVPIDPPPRDSAGLTWNKFLLYGSKDERPVGRGVFLLDFSDVATCCNKSWGCQMLFKQVGKSRTSAGILKRVYVGLINYQRGL